MIKIENIDKSYAGTPVLRGVSLCLGPGERIVLSGASGTGKTTLLRIIAGLENPDAGRIEIDEQTVNAPNSLVPPHLRGIGVVFQQPALWPHMDVLANLAFVTRTKANAEQDARLSSLAKQCGISDLLTRQPSTLSAGQAHRVALARALAAEPRYLLMDEPTSNLDACAKADLNAVTLEFIAQTQAGLLYISHDAEDVTQIGGTHLQLINKAVEIDESRTVLSQSFG